MFHRNARIRGQILEQRDFDRGHAPPPPPGAPVNLQGSDVHVNDAEGFQDGGAIQDFFLYRLKNVPLNKDEPISMPFVSDSGNVEFEDIYCLDLAKKIVGDTT